MNYFDQKFFLQYLREGDELLFVCHKHIALIIDHILAILFLGLLLPGFFYYNDSFSLQSLIPFHIFEWYVAALYIYLLYTVFDWYNDVWLVTDQGLIDIDWNLFARHITYVEYRDIRGVEIHTSSLFDSLLNKGNIVVHAEGEDAEFMLEGAVNPQEVVSYINEVTEELHQHEEDDDKAPFEILLHTLTEMVREHLEGWGSRERSEEVATPEEIEETLHKKGTIDLR